MKYLASLLLAGTAAFAQNVALIKPRLQEPITSVTLNELLINRTLKRHEDETKPIIHQNNSALFMSNIGMKFAFLAVPDKENALLTAISLPLMKAAFEAEGRPGVFEKIEFHTLVKIELLENADGKPGSKIDDFEQTVILSNVESDKRFDIKLTDETALPTQGVFVQLTMLGRCDAAGKLNHDRDFVMYKDDFLDIIDKKWMEYCQPNFPLTERPKGTLTFYKNPNHKADVWQTINEPALHAIKKYPDFNIGFGYTVSTYR